MTQPEHDPSIEHEPHLADQPLSPDSAEPKAARRLDAEHARSDPDEERARHSVFDEPAILPGRTPIEIDRDWYCRNCGYNLRGLLTGHPCPECGLIERYEPPRDGEETYARWAWQASLLARRGVLPSKLKLWLNVVVAAVLAVPAALVCSFLLIEQVGLFLFCLLGPAAAELTKLTVGLFLVERRRARVASAKHLYLVTITSALVFAVVQNLVNLLLIHRNAPIELVAYRWTVATSLHVLCTLIATRGLVRVWETSFAAGGAPTLSRAKPLIGSAVAIHMTYNIVVYVYGYSGFGF